MVRRHLGQLRPSFQLHHYRVHGLGTGDALLFTILCASASYIAVPAAMRLALPEANPGLPLPLALAVTFPLNITLGMPLYLSLIQRFGS